MKLKLICLLAMAAAAAGDDADGGDDANAGNDADANAKRDRSFYRPGFVNPALKNPLFHKSALSVLENLGNFDALYVKYENCAWALYGQPYAKKEAAQNDGDDDEGGGDDDGGFLGCASVDGGDDYWYMGRTFCFRAQAAFSLYGIPKDSSGSIGSKCHKATFINSFFTTMGVEALADPLGVDTSYGNSYCTVYPPGDNDADAEDDAEDEGDRNDKSNWSNFAAYTSSGTGCQNNRFVTDTYGGGSCDGNAYIKTTDTLDNFNKALDNLDCVQIYDSSSDYEYDGDYGGGDGDGEDNHDDNQAAVDFTALDNTVEILKVSPIPTSYFKA